MERRKACLLMVLWVAALLGPPGAGTTGGLTGQEENQAPLSSSKGVLIMWFFVLEEYTGTDRQDIGALSFNGDPGDGRVRYILTGEGAGTLFKIDQTSRLVYATQRLDREEKAEYVLHAKAVNRFTNQVLGNELDFMIKIIDINDNEPRFTEDAYRARVAEMSPIGTSVIQVTATDADDPAHGNNTRVVYSILEGQPYFSVDPETGLIRTALPNMDREVKDNYQLVIQAKDMGGHVGGLTGTTTVSIMLSDVNDNPPHFTKTLYVFRVSESTPPGVALGVIRSLDADIGENAEVDYRVTGGDGRGVFHIATNRSSQEGVVMLAKPLDYEKKQQFSLQVQVENVHVDPRFLHAGPFRDEATIRVTVEDEDEPPVFERAAYIMEVREDAAKGTVIGSVSAADPDVKRSPVRYSIDGRTDMDRVFSVDARNGSLFILQELDREENSWHNITVIASEIDEPQQSSRLPVFVRVLDVNDNAPSFASDYQTFVCEDAPANQVIETLSATDPDEPLGGQRFSFSLAQEAAGKVAFSVRDNKDNTASILTQTSLQRGLQQVPVVIGDGERSSTNTLTVHVCACDRHGRMTLCGAALLTEGAGLSTGTLVAIVLCLSIPLAVAVIVVPIVTAMRRRKKKKEEEEELQLTSQEDDPDGLGDDSAQGGGEEETRDSDTAVQLHPEPLEERRQRGDAVPEAVHPPAQPPALRPSPLGPSAVGTLSLRPPPLGPSPLGPSAPRNPPLGPPLWDKHADLRDFITQKLQFHDNEPTALPHDSLIVYAYEGDGSPAGSLSPLMSESSDDEQDFSCLSQWGPRFQTLAKLYGVDHSSKDP